MLQCNRCRMQLPDGTERCTRCGGTVLTPIQSPPQHQQNQQAVARNGNQPRQVQGYQAPRPNPGQRPQRPNMQQRQHGQQGAQRPVNNGQNMQNTRQNVQGQQTQLNMHRQTMYQQQPINNNDTYFGDGFDTNFEDGFDENTNMFNSDVGQQVQQNQQLQQNQHGQKNQKQNPKVSKIKQQSKDGSSMVDWIITMVLLLIPIVNIIYIVKVLSKKSTEPDYKKNYIKAFLIYFIVMSVLSFIVTAAFSDSIAYWIAATLLATK